MIVTLTEAGGWTNVRRRCSVDTESMPPDLAAHLESSLDALLLARVRELAAPVDSVTLVLEIDGSRRASFTDASAPAEAGPVLEILRPLCQPVPNSRA